QDKDKTEGEGRPVDATTALLRIQRMATDKPAQTPEEKRQAHWLKTKKAMLQLAADKGGTGSLAEMHQISESRYFIAHQRFSQMMEECVDEGLFDVDGHDVVLTDKGRAFLTG